MKVRLKHNEFRDLVNELRDTADRYGGTDQLRDQLAHTLARRVRPVPDIVKMRPVLERIDARLACDVLSASSTVEVLKLARDEIMVLAEEVGELRAALQHEADCVEAAKAEVAALRAELAGLRSSMEFRTSLIGRTEAERDALRASLEAAEKERDAAELMSLALRAKVAEMEQQEPVTWMQSTHLSSFKNRLCGSQSSYVHCSDHQLHPDFKPLYALPGAQPAPSVPDGWREGVESAARLIDQKAELYAIRFGRDDMGVLSFGTGAHAEIKMDHYTGLLELADEVRAMLASAPKPEGE